MEKERPHSLHGKGRSPRCVAWCKRSARGQLSTRRQMPHWLGARAAAAAAALIIPRLGISMPAKPDGLPAVMPRAANISRVKVDAGLSMVEEEDEEEVAPCEVPEALELM